jgi:predicted S18 family serine protease
MSGGPAILQLFDEFKGKDKVAVSKFSGAPLAPQRVNWFLALSISQQGRRDSKKYAGLKDFTRTHALIVAQSKAQAGQHRVNQWLILALDPLTSGNERILVQEEELQEQILSLKTQRASNGRETRALQKKAAELAERRGNLRSQRKANQASMDSLNLSAQEALDSWETLYNQMASLYSRARAIKSKSEISKVASEVPVFSSIPLATNHHEQVSPTKKAGKTK